MMRKVRTMAINCLHKELSNTYKKVLRLKKYMELGKYKEDEEFIKFFVKEIKYYLDKYCESMQGLIKELKKEEEEI